MRLTPAILRMYPFTTLLRQSAKASSVKPDVQQYLFETMGRLSKSDIVTIMSATTGILRDDPDYRIPRPFLLIRGERDTAGAIKKQAPVWAAREPQCRFVVIPDAGHCSNQDNPERFNQVVLEYLAQHSGLATG